MGQNFRAARLQHGPDPDEFPNPEEVSLEALEERSGPKTSLNGFGCIATYHC